MLQHHHAGEVVLVHVASQHALPQRQRLAFRQRVHMRAMRGTVAGKQLVHPPELRLALRLRPEQHALALLANGRAVLLAGG